MDNVKRTQEFTQRVSETIYQITGCHITISNKDNIRIAGTGNFKQCIGEKIPEKSAFKHALKSKETVVIENPKENHLCKSCAAVEDCQEKYEISTPIITEDNVIGVIGIIATTDEQKDFILSKKNTL